MCHGSRVERPLSFTANAQNGALGEKSVHPHPSKTFSHAKTTVPV